MASRRRQLLLLLVLIKVFTLSACATIDLDAGTDTPVRKRIVTGRSTSAARPSLTADTVTASSQSAAKRPGGYYQDDGPASEIPEGLLNTPDAEPAIEPLAKGPSRPYVVFGKTYVPITDDRPFVQRGTGSWYGKKFHGQRTASGEPYDMFKMTAAHPTLPIPSYARVTNLSNGRQVIVRINDRGPFHTSRIIDLSYTAALKLDLLRGGSTELEVERLLPDAILRMQADKQADKQALREPGTPTGGREPEAQAQAQASTGFYLQLGAFAQEQNAQAARDQLLRSWPADFPQPFVMSSQGWFRLHSGPFGSRELAAEAARRIREAAAIPTIVVQR